jgi:plastocyanin
VPARIISTFVLAALMAAAAPAGARQATPAPAAPPSATSAPAAAVVVHMKGFAFTPTSVTIKAGDTVQFLNDDTTAHTATADDKSWDSGNMDIGATYSHTFATPGTVTYVCAYHGFMRGTIVVK